MEKSTQSKFGNRRKSPLLKAFLIFVLLIVSVLVIERFRGQWAFAVWAREMSAKGETLEAKKLWPPPSREMIDFTASLSNSLNKLPPNLLSYAGGISPIVSSPSGKWLRGSQQPIPTMPYRKAGTTTWSDIDAAVKEAEPVLSEIRRLMKSVPRGISYDISTIDDNPPNFVGVRLAAQALHTSACRNLHKNDVPAAFDDLCALQKFVTVGQDDPGPVSLMIGIAVLGITVDVLWDALQAEGWTDEQLATLQELCQQNRNLLSQLPRAMEAANLEHLSGIDWFRHHTYNEVIVHDSQVFESFGLQREDIQRAAQPIVWRQWVFHPLWRFAWADQEKLQSLKDHQKNLAALRAVTLRKSWQQLEKDLATNRASYRAPVAAWRFYRRLPLREDFPGSDWQPLKPGEYPYTDFARAWTTSLHNLTLNELALAAIAIKRYQLRHGMHPPTLADLSPEILKDSPRDLMDGNPLRYHTHPGGTFTLYSIFHWDGFP